MVLDLLSSLWHCVSFVTIARRWPRHRQCGMVWATSSSLCVAFAYAIVTGMTFATPSSPWHDVDHVVIVGMVLAKLLDTGEEENENGLTLLFFFLFS